ncbi:hypothetical protein Tsubulata_040868 [Turnera subulata]|uniref:Uncharacterized protein n=1 Tax=Turnera subulata TaxID=218843 RepID=A0A9Q0IZ86_9ROSI|nr:hypothetical protein Tsubulata_040868 [Turnera subulata]
MNIMPGRLVVLCLRCALVCSILFIWSPLWLKGCIGVFELRRNSRKRSVFGRRSVCWREESRKKSSLSEKTIQHTSATGGISVGSNLGLNLLL